ncbi:MAG: AI-2E family transporter [Lentisphaerae bacterium]|nr:AI-2E family transporter [Lentisphaerota bacterium]
MFKAVTERLRKVFEKPVNKAIDTVAGLFSGHDQLNDDEKQIIALFKAMLPEDRSAREKAVVRFRHGLEKQDINDRKISNLISFLLRVAPGTPGKALPVLKKYDVLQQQNVISNLLLVAMDHDDYRSDALEIIRQLTVGLEWSEEEFDEVANRIRQAHCGRGRIIRSGTGIVLALVVIAVFVMVAAWLSSLLFGLVLAYIFLPLEQFFERKLRREPGWLAKLFCRLNFLRLISNKLKRKSNFELSAEELERRKQQAITNKATTLTVSTVVVGGALLLVALVFLLSAYIGSLRKDFAEIKEKNIAAQLEVEAQKQAAEAEKAEPAGKTPAAPQIEAGLWSDENIQPPEVAEGEVSEVPADKKANRNDFLLTISNNLAGMLDRLRHQFESLPMVQNILKKLSDYLVEGEAEEQITAMLLKRSGGTFAFISNFIGMFASFLLNLLLTFFFFSLFLSKLASFVNSSNDRNLRPSSYLIRTVFNGKWLPQMAEENLREGDRIVGEVVNKLRIWLRGYMTMIAIDYCVYTTVFVLLKLPYAPLLGAVAAVGILLPYIGPVSSALLTVLVTLAVGGADVTVWQITGAIGVYLIHNGIIEQFFIYPWIIGESLGLSTLETIIVVLLGGILAGIPGMIFALPVASVVKYLVPQIYRCWR